MWSKTKKKKEETTLTDRDGELGAGRVGERKKSISTSLGIFT